MMNAEDNYIEINKNLWNSRTEAHLKSDFYDVGSFLKGKSSLNEIELKLLGDVNGKSILHLQCHFGQDSISLGRMGATVTGVDLSDKAITAANELALKTNIPAAFICCDLYDLPKHLDKKFDIVFTSYGTIGWLPDLSKWAKIISRFLKAKGKFIFADFHPVIWMFDNNFEKVAYNYFKDQAIIETEEGTYADRKAEIRQQSVGWNHSISEVLNSLIAEGLSINSMNEYDYSPYNCFNNTVEAGPNQYRIKHFENKIPMVFAIEAQKES